MGLALVTAHEETSLEREGALDSGVAIEAFLREVETRAFRIALLNVRDRDEALDIVQDAMIRLVRRYAQRPSAEWRPLFYRILQNRIRDVQRRRSVRSRVLTFFGGVESEDEQDPLLAAPGPQSDDPLAQVAAGDAMRALEQALLMLPARQREAFVLRNFEGLDVLQTAAAMNCTEGSVKTHYSRAVHRLRELLKEHVEEHSDE
ncbi:MAG TPA: RNA polymerase sigma factor [Gammaproteobacteria bacterium]|jgi:RNA polymerase sigma-70 factor (ECF subfamily)|nr:RNA polymerase sigma factor [Gammaproteobacteria bacterium]